MIDWTRTVAGPRKQQRECKRGRSKLYVPYKQPSPRAVYAAFAWKRNVRRGLWRQPNIASMAEQLALNDYKTPAARRATQS